MTTYQVTFADEFRGDNAALVRCIHALLELDKMNALAPHGIGGHAHGMLAAAAARLQALPPGIEQAALDELETCRAILPGLQRDHDGAMDERNEARQDAEYWRAIAQDLCGFVKRLCRDNPGPVAQVVIAYLASDARIASLAFKATAYDY